MQFCGRRLNSVTSLAVAALVACAAAAEATTSCALAAASAHLPSPSVAPGYDVRLVASGLTKPRGIIFDQAGHLLVVQQQTNVIALTLEDNGGSCVSVTSKKTVIDDATLNHGIALSFDGGTLYASSPEAVYSWSYNPMAASNTSEPQTLVANMTTSDHTTRTLLLSHKKNGTLVVTRGSTANIDPEAAQISSGHSQIKAFDLLTRGSDTYNFDTDGTLLGWGLRNDVGIDEHPVSGGLYAVENSVDQLSRYGQDIHETNPAEKLNFLGYLNGTESANQGGNFGYPFCYAAWDVSSIPNNQGLKTGMQFAMGYPNSTVSDSICQNERVAPRLVFESHMAPLDIKFNNAGSEAWVTFHGSWDRSDPAGYKVSVVPFSNGEPVAPSTSNTGYMDIITNPDDSQCPDNCFRPVGLAWDSKGRLFFSSDDSGEIYMITQSSGAAVQSATPGLGASATASDSATGTASVSSSASSTAATAGRGGAERVGQSLAYVIALALGTAVLLM